MNDFLQRLRERKLVQWALAYVAAAFALIQVLDIVAQRFGWPESIERFAIVALAIGFFVTLVLAWYHGERGAQRVSGTELLILALLLAIGGAVVWRVAPSTNSPEAKAYAAAPGSTSVAVVPADRKSIAVLPFESLSKDEDNAYFASGMQDMILTKIAGIGDLKVVSRTSTEKYKSHPDDLKTIAQQLGVATVLEGSVQKSGNQVLINLQLIDAASDNHLWAEAYPRTLDNIFGVEGEVAQKVAEALKAKLTPAEIASVAKAPTQNADAYDLYLRGLAHYNRANDEYILTSVEVPQAIPLFEEALAKDPGFALAASALAKAHMYAYWFQPDRTDARLATAKAMADRALELQPDLGDAHYALGLYLYWGFRNYPAAHEQFDIARKTLPNNADVELTDAAIARRQGRLDQAIAGFQRAAMLAPHSSGPYFNLAQCYMQQRNYAEADRLFGRAAEVTADPEVQLLRRAENLVFWKGDLMPMRTALDAMKRGTDVYTANGLRLEQFAWWSRDFAAATAVVTADSAGNWYDATNIALPKRLYLAWAYAADGDDARAKSLYAELREKMQLAVRERPADSGLHLALGFADAGLGLKQEAIAEGRKAAELTPVDRDAFSGPGYLCWLAKLYVRVGAKDQSIDLIEKLSAMPAGMVISAAMLKVDPVWDPLRHDPHFQKAIADIEGRSATHE
ncbi:MAG TPA: tetratricopeptide repeat protein [Rudaea sp.]|uniref:tetratricopeptide repeat protein n=1 Tax=Rudaea sp. TaxID=2136325 RepID=UPI002F92B592